MITLTVTNEEVQLIGNALAELPFKLSAPLLNKLQQQVNEQLKPANEVKE